MAADGQRFLIPRIAPYSLTVFDRGGKVVRTLDRGVYTSPTWSPDGTRVAVVKDTRTIWVVDANTGKSTQLAANQPEDVVTGLVWSPDGRQIAYHVRKIDRELIYKVSADGTGPEELVFRLPGFGLSLTDWSPDGRYLIYYSQQLAGNRLFALPVTPEPKPIEIMKSDLPINGARISPDGRLIAYQSTESAESPKQGIYVRTLDLAAGKTGETAQQVKGDPSFGMGLGVSWRQDGRELYYLAPKHAVMAVDVTASPALDWERHGCSSPFPTRPTTRRVWLLVGQRGARWAARRVPVAPKGASAPHGPDLSARHPRPPGQSTAASRADRSLRAGRALAGRHAHRDADGSIPSLRADDPTSGSWTSPPARPRRSPTTRRQTSLQCGRQTASRFSTSPRARAAIRGFTARRRMEPATRS